MKYNFSQRTACLLQRRAFGSGLRLRGSRSTSSGSRSRQVPQSVVDGGMVIDLAHRTALQSAVDGGMVIDLVHRTAPQSVVDGGMVIDLAHRTACLLQRRAFGSGRQALQSAVDGGMGFLRLFLSLQWITLWSTVARVVN
jgi:hypothetical protein